jgi:acetylornithine/succinyldiaminopimelate/putrescine aminotransferase
MKVVLNTKSHDTEKFGGPGKLSRNVYQQLGSLVKCKNLVGNYNRQDTVVEDGKISYYTDELSNEFRDFLDAMEALNNGSSNNLNDRAVDAYLGELGVTEEYQYALDFNTLGEPIDVAGQDPYRNVVQTINGLTYNVVHQGQNVVHATS